MPYRTAKFVKKGDFLTNPVKIVRRRFLITGFVKDTNSVVYF